MKQDFTQIILRKVRCTLLLLCCFIQTMGQAQVPVKGVVQGESELPLPGVNVTVKGTATGTITDIDGRFELTIPSTESALVVSFIGYVTQEIIPGSNSALKITLAPDRLALDEVVVVGYGQRRKSDITGAISTLKGSEIENRAVTRVEQALQGMVPGLNVTNANGQPGSQGVDFKIRGTSTFSGNPVLTIIDGVPSSLDRINPNDVESISVLKDAASAAIYGSRATGGVIIVTTKNGKAGIPKFSYSGIVGIQSPTRYPEKVSVLDHALLLNEARVNDGLPAKYSDAELSEMRSPGFKSYDWEDAMMRQAFQQNHNFSVSGGGERYGYYVSLGYLSQDGIVINSSQKRFNIQVNQNFNVSDKLKFSMKTGVSPSTRIAPPIDGFFNHVAQKPRLHAIKSEDGKWLQHPESAGAGRNPIARISPEGGQELLKGTRFLGNFTMDYTPLSNLTLTGTYGLTSNQDRLRNYQKKITYYKQYSPDEVASYTDFNILTVDNSSNVFQNVNLLASYSKRFGKHQLSVMAGSTAEWYSEFNDFVETRDFLTDELYAISAGSGDRSLWNISGDAADWSLASFISRGNYSYLDKYYIEGIIRRDGSSRFREDIRWGTFPSVSAGWILSQEKFLRNSKVISFLKIRGSWGQVGNQNAGGYYPFANTLVQNSVFFNESPFRGVRPAGAPNPLLTWETKESINLGIEGNLLSGLLEFNLELFKEKTKDILLQLPVPTTFGQMAPVQNAGTVENRGWELELHHRKKINAFSYGVTFQISDATNKVIDMVGTGPRISGNQITEEGRPMNEWYGLKSIGYFQSEGEVADAPFQNAVTSPGDLRFEENGGNPNAITPDDRVRLGRSDSRFPFGIRLNFNYRNFDLLLFGQGVMKGLRQSQGYTAFNFDRDVSTIRTYHLDRWTPETPNARFPKPRNGQLNNVNTQFSSFWLEDASYFRFKNLQLGYTFNGQATGKWKMGPVRIYAGGENLLIITRYLGYDPETTNSAVYPLPKMYNLGINASF